MIATQLIHSIPYLNRLFRAYFAPRNPIQAIEQVHDVETVIQFDCRSWHTSELFS